MNRTFFKSAFAWPIILGCLACQPVETGPGPVRPRPEQAMQVQDQSWFGEGVAMAPHPHADFAWSASDLSLFGQAVELAPWEVPATPESGEAPTAWWLEQREKVTRILQSLTVQGVRLAQQLRLPEDAPPAYRLQGRILAFDRQTRVGAKVGQSLGNILVVPVNLVLALGSTGGRQMGVPFFGRVSGFRTEVLYQLKLTDLRTQRTVLALQSWMDFRSLHLPVSLREALWDLGGGASATRSWWPAANMKEIQGGLAWFAPDLDLTGIPIRCLNWLPEPTGSLFIRESQLDSRLQALALPALLASKDPDDPDLLLSEREGSLYLQGQAFGPKTGTCQVKLWDSASGRVLACLELTTGPLSFNPARDWVEQIRELLGTRVRPRPGRKQPPAPGPTYR